jgi:hypothetical protein
MLVVLVVMSLVFGLMNFGEIKESYFHFLHRSSTLVPRRLAMHKDNEQVGENATKTQRNKV